MALAFQTHLGEVLPANDAKLVAACETVAQWYEDNARATRIEDAYASHVTEQKKDELMLKQFDWAEQVRQRKNLHNFSVWQRVNAELTGECVALLP